MSGNISSEKILVTGGTGFLGRHVVERLVAEGKSPTVLARNKQSEISFAETNKVDSVGIDLLDTDCLKVFLEDYRPDVIIHLAGQTFKKDDQEADLEKYNFDATKNLLNLARETKTKKIIITGTADEYGFQSGQQKETMATTPISEYAISKNKAVKYALSLHAKYHLPVIVLRPFTVYGIGQPARMFVSQAVECALKNLPFEMSKGVQKRDLVFVTDFADVIIKTLNAKNIEGEVFNVGSGKAIALRELAEKIWSIARADSALLKIGARPTKDSELHDTQADISKIRAILGWQPEISLDQGLTVIIEKRRQELNEREVSISTKS